MPQTIAIAGLGTVGAGLLRLLLEGREPLAAAHVSARSRTADRGVPLDPYTWWDDPVAMASEADADIFVELIGGEDGVAKAAVEAAIEAGKHVVTANKAMIAKHGLALAKAAEAKGVALRFEAAVAGGVPVVRTLRDGIAGAAVTSLEGVLNGTCNFILAAMEDGMGYPEALEEAQRLGFAEADPSFDVGGIDAGQKLAILSGFAFAALPPLADIAPRGIERVTPEDLTAARALGLRMKLVAILKREEGGLSARLCPALVPLTSALDIGGGSENIVVADAEALGRIALSGPGAGGGPTASAVLADLVGIARGGHGPAFGRPSPEIDTAPRVAQDQTPVPHFLRVVAEDRPGVLAALTEVLGRTKVSVETIRQTPAPRPDRSAEIVITTHASSTASLEEAAGLMTSLSAVLGEPSVYPILNKD